MIVVGGLSLFWTQASMLLVYNKSKLLYTRISIGNESKTGPADFPIILFYIGRYFEAMQGD